MDGGIIYLIENGANDKVYVGQTTKTAEERWRGHLSRFRRLSKSYPDSLSRWPKLYLAFRKYGISSFHIRQIDSAENRKELDEKEKYYIKFYDSIENGYNMLPGGVDFQPMADESVKARHDEIMQSDGVRGRISKSLRDSLRENGQSEEHKKRVKEARAKRKEERKELGLGFYEHPERMASRKIAVKCILEFDEEHSFESIKEAGLWWYRNYKPFGETYSQATYQRKIEDSANGRPIVYNNRGHRFFVNNIKWYFSDADRACIIKSEERYESKNKRKI